MPVGEGLAIQIRDQLSREIVALREGSETPIVGALLRQGQLSEGLHGSAMRRIRDGIVGSESIDDFVNEWKDFPGVPEVAKLAIAFCILAAEGKTDLARLDAKKGDEATVLGNLRDSWLGRLLRFHNAGSTQRRSFLEGMGDIAFITFNYDRTVEQYLWHHVTRTLAIPRDEAIRLIAQIPIIHVYGSVGMLPAFRGQVAFGDPKAHILTHAAEGIQTYCETVDSSRARAIDSYMQQAERHIFLGAAFHAQNMEILYPTGKANNEKVSWATTLGAGRRAKARLGTPLANARSELHEFDGPASELLRLHHDDLFD